MTHRVLRFCLFASIVCALAGCGPKIVRDRVYEQPDARVELRHALSGGEVVARGFSHPATVSDVRVAHILASLSYEDEDGKRQPAIRAQFVYDLGDGISKALAKAGPDDEVAAAVFPEDRRLGIFTDRRVTAFRLHVSGDTLEIDFFSIEESVERESNRPGARDYEIPIELPGFAPRFKLIAGQAQRRAGKRGIEVAWRDAYFRRPVSLGFRDGQPRRRTVLMELPPEDSGAKTGEAPLPPNLSDAQLRAIDQLDSSRQSGLVTEGEYQRRRALVLENRLEEAGYGAEIR